MKWKFLVIMVLILLLGCTSKPSIPPSSVPTTLPPTAATTPMPTPPSPLDTTPPLAITGLVANNAYVQRWTLS